MEATQSSVQPNGDLSLVLPPQPKPQAQKELPKWVKLTEVSLEIKKADLTFDEWAELINQLKLRDKSRQWVLGDGLNDGEARFGETAFQVIDPAEEAEKEEEGGETYRQYQQVAFRIPFGSRLPKLSWGHHQVVAYLEEGRRDYWLHKALTEGMKRQELRRQVRKEKRKEEAKSGKAPKVKELELIHDEEAQAFFDGYLEALQAVEAAIPKYLPSARMMNHAQQGMVLWQKNRTVEADCQAIVEMFAGGEGTEGPETATDSDISVWLHRNNYFMGDYDLDDRLAYMVEKKILQVVSPEASRQEGRRGVMLDLYKLHPDFEAKMKD